jgi:hypothetical protein
MTAGALYARHGCQPPAKPDTFMERIDPTVGTRAAFIFNDPGDKP